MFLVIRKLKNDKPIGYEKIRRCSTFSKCITENPYINDVPVYYLIIKDEADY